jgi:thioredoxin-dependent peroxiredoxin
MGHFFSWAAAHIWFILFFAWGIPLGIYRSRFRQIVYRTDSWLINIKPYFIRETKALFTTMYPDDADYVRFRNFYRFYLAVYAVLFALWYAFG